MALFHQVSVTSPYFIVSTIRIYLRKAYSPSWLSPGSILELSPNGVILVTPAFARFLTISSLSLIFILIETVCKRFLFGFKTLIISSFFKALIQMF